MNQPNSIQSRTVIIAEIGVNHNGDVQLAKELIDAAFHSGADIVKFQTFKTEHLVSSNARLANYQSQNQSTHANQYTLLKSLELSEDDFSTLFEYSSHVGIEFLSTAFDLQSIKFLSSLPLARWKIPSGEITNLPYLRAIANLRLPVILSTGMATISDISSALDIFLSSGYSKYDLTVLHCTTEYPTRPEEVNLRALLTIRDVFGISTGYSDHTSGTFIAPCAVAMGATIIEKHLTLDTSLPGPDHKASVNPSQFAQMVESIRYVETLF